MATLAGLIFALSFVNEPLEPRIDWVYSATACESCAEAQIQLMARYFWDGDYIYIQDASKNKKWASQMMTRFKKAHPGAIILKETAPYPQVRTGWILEDPVTHEEVLYYTRKDQYGTFRSQALLQIFRDPISP